MEDPLVTLLALSNPIDAEIIRGLLEAADIDVFLQDVNVTYLGMGYNWASGGVKVQVRQSDLPKAQKILEDTANEDQQNFNEQDEESTNGS